jgi:plasmid stabilization system protein ParE
MVIRWTAPAKEHLRRLHDTIALDSPFYAKKVTQSIVEKSGRLELFPRSGRVVPELDDETLREILVYSYRLIYSILDDEVLILALVHTKQDLSAGLPTSE